MAGLDEEGGALSGTAAGFWHDGERFGGRGAFSPVTRSLVVLLALLLAPSASSAQQSRLIVELEGGPVWQSRNDVRIPNDASGTRFSLRAVTGSGPWPAVRIYVTWRHDERNELRALVAPLSFTETGALDRPVEFAGSSYAPDVRTTGTYRFNSYRITYRRRVHEGASWTWYVGGTAKIRDALIELRQGATTSRKKDVGFVPLLHLASDWRLSGGWHLTSDIDALAGGPGRAEDVAVKLRYDPGRRWGVAAGYRTVEGGANVDAVYTFAWLHYAVLSVLYRM